MVDLKGALPKVAERCFDSRTYEPNTLTTAPLRHSALVKQVLEIPGPLKTWQVLKPTLLTVQVWRCLGAGQVEAAAVGVLPADHAPSSRVNLARHQAAPKLHS